MAVTVAELLARLGLDVGPFKQGVQEAQRSSADLMSAMMGVTKPVQEVGEKADQAGTAAKGLGDAFRGVGQQGAYLFGSLGPLILSLGGVGIGLGVAALAAKASISEFTQFSMRVRDLSYLSGASTKDVSILAAGLEDLGVESDTVQVALSKMSAAIVSGDDAFKRLGVSTRDSSGRNKDAVQIFYETVDALGKMSDKTLAASLARDIFGRGWTQMIPLLARGSEEIQRLGEESNKLISPDDIKRTQEYQLAWRDLLNVWERFKISVGREIIIPITVTLKWLTPSGEKVGRESQNWLEAIFGRDMANLIRGGPVTDIGNVYSDVGAARGGMPAPMTGIAGTKPPEYPREMQDRLKYETQLAQLRAQSATAAAVGEAERFAAAKQTIRAMQDEQLAVITLQEAQLDPKMTVELKRLADLRVAINRVAIARIGAEDYKHQQEVSAQADVNSKGWIAAADEQIILDEKVAIFEAQQAEERWKNIQKMQESEIAGWVSVAEERLAQDEKLSLEEVQRLEEHWKNIQKVQDNEISGWVSVAEQEIAASDAAAHAEVSRLEEMWRLPKRLKQIGIEVSLVGREHFDELTARINATRGAMQEMIAGGIEPTDTKLQELGVSLAELYKVEELRTIFRDVFSSISDAVSMSFKGIIQGTQSMEDAFRNMGQNIALSLLDNIVKKGLAKVESALEDFLLTAGGGLLGNLLGSLVPAAASTTPMMAETFAGFYQEGGVVPGPRGMPTLGVLHGGEEVLTPEQRMGGGGPIVQQIFNVSPGVPETARREIWAMMPIIEQRTVNAVLSARNRGGEVASAVGARRR